MRLTQKIQALDVVQPSVNYNGVGLEFNINESIVYIKSSVFTQKHT